MVTALAVCSVPDRYIDFGPYDRGAVVPSGRPSGRADAPVGGAQGPRAHLAPEHLHLEWVDQDRGLTLRAVRDRELSLREREGQENELIPGHDPARHQGMQELERLTETLPPLEPRQHVAGAPQLNVTHQPEGAQKAVDGHRRPACRSRPTYGNTNL